MTHRFRTVAVMTGTRAEYGLMSWLIRELHEADDLELRLIVSGTHLSEAFGHTVDQIERDGIPVSASVECVGDSDSNAGMARDFSRAAAGFAEALDALKPDILILLGDRFEALAAAAAAAMLKIPIGHIHGGEVTEGALDESFRHAITKLSHLHFTAAPPYARRVVQMGEQPSRVHVIGAIGLDGFNRLDLMTPDNLSRETGLDLSRGYGLVTFHPATVEQADAAEQARTLTAAFEAAPNLPLIMTKANADPGGRAVNAVFEAFAADHPGRVFITASLGQRRYFSAMKHAAMVIGNSSSGIIEAPAAGVPTIDIGTRQQGRLRADTIVGVPVDAGRIVEAIRRILAGERPGAGAPPPYGQAGDATGAILRILRADQPDNLLVKRFQDLDLAMPPETGAE